MKCVLIVSHVIIISATWSIVYRFLFFHRFFRFCKIWAKSIEPLMKSSMSIWTTLRCSKMPLIDYRRNSIITSDAFAVRNYLSTIFSFSEYTESCLLNHHKSSSNGIKDTHGSRDRSLWATMVGIGGSLCSIIIHRSIMAGLLAQARWSSSYSAQHLYCTISRDAGKFFRAKQTFDFKLNYNLHYRKKLTNVEESSSITIANGIPSKVSKPMQLSAEMT